MKFQSRLLSLCCLLCTASAYTAGPDVVAGDYIALARQGDLRRAPELFGILGNAGGSPLDRELATSFENRFILQNDSGTELHENIFINRLMRIYTRYWTRSLLGELAFEHGKTWLESEIGRLLIDHDPHAALATGSGAMAALDRALSLQGVYFDRSFVAPWYDLLLWTRQRSERRQIRLTDQVIDLEVVFMDDFISLGWTEFATLGMTSSGGWTGSDAIYCVSFAWDRDSENFEVSFLKHEGRHFADFRQFTDLEVVDLEYRAKLTELAFADRTLAQILANFTVNSAANAASPHSRANHLVIRDLQRAVFGSGPPPQPDPWRQVPRETVNQAAAVLLEQDSARLRATGAGRIVKTAGDGPPGAGQAESIHP
jgi:hypothetical protein